MPLLTLFWAKVVRKMTGVLVSFFDCVCALDDAIGSAYVQRFPKDGVNKAFSERTVPTVYDLIPQKRNPRKLVTQLVQQVIF